MSDWSEKLALLVIVETILIAGLIAEVRAQRAELRRAPVIQNCSQVVNFPDAVRPGWYCVPSGEEG